MHVRDDAREHLGAPRGGWAPRDTRLEILPGMRALDARHAGLLEAWHRRHPGERSGTKVALLDAGAHGDRRAPVRFAVQRTTWAQIRALHEALERDAPGKLHRELAPRVLTAQREGPPNLLAVHGVVETADGQLVLTRRATSMRYHPSHWSASLEEGVEPADLAFGDAALHEACVRGIREELGREAAPPRDAVRLLSVFLEARLLNPAVLAHARLACPAAALRPQREEVAALAFVPFTIDSLARQTVAATHAGEPWHPTSRFRMVTVMRHRFGEDAAEEALHRAQGTRAGRFP